MIRNKSDVYLLTGKRQIMNEYWNMWAFRVKILHVYLHTYGYGKKRPCEIFRRGTGP